MAKNSMLIIIPVLNETNNIFPLLKKIFKYLKNKKKHILFIDDNSTDGTRNKIKQAKKKYKPIHLIKRSRKLGIGSAHKIGLAWGFKNKYKLIITMDCDGTHDPKHIRKMIVKIKSSDLVISNRFLKKNSLKGWDIKRIIITFKSKHLSFTCQRKNCLFK